MAFKYQAITKIVIDGLCLFLVFIPWIVLQAGAQPYKRGFFCNDVSLRYPYKDSTVPSWVATLLSHGINIGSVLIIEAILVFGTRKYAGQIPFKIPAISNLKIPLYIAKCYRPIGMFMFGAAIQQTVTNIAKYSIGRLRPHFITICEPDFTTIQCTDSLGRYLFIEDYTCIGADEHRLKEMRLSFMSGHSSLTMYSAVYFVVYLQSRMTWNGSRLLRPLIQIIATILAVLVGISRICDYKHHWSDVLTGALMGAITALIVGYYISGLFREPNMKLLIKEMAVLYSAVVSKSPKHPLMRSLSDCYVPFTPIEPANDQHLNRSPSYRASIELQQSQTSRISQHEQPLPSQTPRSSQHYEQQQSSQPPRSSKNYDQELNSRSEGSHSSGGNSNRHSAVSENPSNGYANQQFTSPMI